ncbi:MAG: helix-turn-helix transcriptional regulator [Rubricoccaceae bacterium]|nr:helix-turn-helix transcriptional regulator [Rubricoccaceae bacterium]
MGTPLHLSRQDQRGLAAAAEALLSPLVHVDADAWRRAVCDRLRSLLGADMAMVLLPGPDGVDLFTEDFDPSITEYPRRADPVISALDAFARLRVLGAATRPMIYGRLLGAFYRSPLWTEFGRHHRAYKSLTLSVAVGPRPTLAHHAQILLNKDSPHKAPFGERGAAIGRLLLPALQTGALAWRRTARARASLTTLVDAMAIGALLFDADGREVHRNPVAAGLLASVPDGPARAAQLVRGLLASDGAAGLLDPVPPPVAARLGPLVLRATTLAPGAAGPMRSFLVMIETVGAPRPDLDPSAAEALQARRGLTAQQARVALLLAARRSTQEIAEALSISPHTVRRHVEQVLDRLGVARRTEVEAAVRQALAGRDDASAA